MTLKRLTVEGLRGFSERTEFRFSIPDKITPGSGLTVLVGANNSGKSTVIEAIHLLNSNTNVVPLTTRSAKSGGMVMIEVEDVNGDTITLKSTEHKGAFVQKLKNGIAIDHHTDNDLNTLILSSKRNFASTFSNDMYLNRKAYKSNINDSDYRSEDNINHNFGGRLLSIYKNRELFEECLEKVLNPLPNWTIESTNRSDQLFLEFSFDEIKHSSKGAGDGFINIFNIVDALYDSSENNVILIDEPEISLHPDLQRKLFNLLVEYSKDKQIIISTHSPYFVDWRLFSEKAKIIRLKKSVDSIKKFELTETTKKGILGITNDYQKPHILSLNANEIFFLSDNVILTEGQDDVICYRELFKKYGYQTSASFFGWGAGGASNVQFILNILNDLGYEKVFTIFDHDKKAEIDKLQLTFQNYGFFAIDTNDVRNKKRDSKINKLISEINKMDFEKNAKEKILKSIETKFHDTEGLIKSMSNFEINQKYEGNIKILIEQLKKYFESEEMSRKVVSMTRHKESEKIKDEIKVEILFGEWMRKYNLYNKLEKRYGKFQNVTAGGMIISIKQISTKKYYVISNYKILLSPDYIVEYLYFVSVDLKKETVVLKKVKEIKNTLPISRIRKLFGKLFIRY